MPDKREVGVEYEGKIAESHNSSIIPALGGWSVSKIFNNRELSKFYTILTLGFYYFDLGTESKIPEACGMGQLGLS
jgi:hypothetical protein